MGRRITVFVAVVAAHVLALVFIPATHRSLQRAIPEPPAMAMLFLAPLVRDETVAGQDGPRLLNTPTARRLVPSGPIPAQSNSAPGDTNTAITPDSVEQPAPASIDWNLELGDAASRQIARDAAAKRRASALDHASVPRYLAPVPGSPQFGWNYAATHRVEFQPLLVVHVNDRCVWVALFFAACKIGAMPANGELFKRMRDSPPEGQPDLP